MSLFNILRVLSYLDLSISPFVDILFPHINNYKSHISYYPYYLILFHAVFTTSSSEIWYPFSYCLIDLYQFSSYQRWEHEETKRLCNLPEVKTACLWPYITEALLEIMLFICEKYNSLGSLNSHSNFNKHLLQFISLLYHLSSTPSFHSVRIYFSYD